MQSERKLLAFMLTLAIVSSIFVSETMAGGKDKGEDIILYNGNIVLRGGKGKGKGGSIVVANSPGGMEMLPMFDWGNGFGRRK